MHSSLSHAIAATRRRIRVQRALETLTSVGLGGALAATVLVYLLKARIFSLHHFWLGLSCVGGAVLLAGLAAALRRVPAAHVAKLIDDSHDLHDRMGTALEFSQTAERTDFMRAQVEDAVRHATDVAAKRAAPLRWPRDIRALGLLLLCLAVVVVLRFPTAPPPAVAVVPVEKLEIDPEELEPHRELAKQLQKDADDGNQPELGKMAQELNKLFDQIERKELTKKELFAKLAELEKKYMDGMDGSFDDMLKKLKKVGDELQKDKLTKEIGDALKRAELKKAKEELEKLAKQIDKLKAQEKKQLARTLDKAAQQKLDKKDDLQKKKDELEKQIKRLQKQLKQNPKDEQAKRRLEKKQRQLERLNQEQQRQAEQRRQLERLNQQMQQAAESLRQKLSPEAQKALQQLAQQMGKFAQQLSKLGMQGKAQGQLSDLKELLRRLGQGQKGQQGKLQDFILRAGGSKPGQQGKLGQGKDGKGKDGKQALVLGQGGQDGTLVLPIPGQGQQPGKAGQGQDNPQGQPGNGIGTSTNPDFMGKASSLKSSRKDQFVRGKEGKGPTRSEVILGAAEKGFSSQSYRRVYQDYSQVIEDALKQEDVPLGYKYFVKRYFQLIKPR